MPSTRESQTLNMIEPSPWKRVLVSALTATMIAGCAYRPTLPPVDETQENQILSGAFVRCNPMSVQYSLEDPSGNKYDNRWFFNNGLFQGESIGKNRIVTNFTLTPEAGGLTLTFHSIQFDAGTAYSNSTHWRLDRSNFDNAPEGYKNIAVEQYRQALAAQHRLMQDCGLSSGMVGERRAILTNPQIQDPPQPATVCTKTRSLLPAFYSPYLGWGYAAGYSDVITGKIDDRPDQTFYLGQFKSPYVRYQGILGLIQIRKLDGTVINAFGDFMSPGSFGWSLRDGFRGPVHYLQINRPGQHPEAVDLTGGIYYGDQVRRPIGGNMPESIKDALALVEKANKQATQKCGNWLQKLLSEITPDKGPKLVKVTALQNRGNATLDFPALPYKVSGTVGASLTPLILG